MSNPGAHASHANTYSHGASSVPVSKSKKVSSTAAAAAATAVPSSGNVSSSSSSSTASNSARDNPDDRRSHEPSVGSRRSNTGVTDRPAAVPIESVAAPSGSSGSRRASSLRRASGESPASMISVATPIRPAVVLSANDISRGSASASLSSSSAPSPSHTSATATASTATMQPMLNTMGGGGTITTYPTLSTKLIAASPSSSAAAAERRTPAEQATTGAGGVAASPSSRRVQDPERLDRDSRAGKPSSSPSGTASAGAGGGSFVTATTATTTAARYSGNESGSSTRMSSAGVSGAAVRSDGAVVADGAMPRVSPSSKPSSSSSSSSSSQQPSATGVAAPGSSSSSSSSASKKPPKPLSRKKAQLLAEQVAVVDLASNAAALLAERRELELRIRAREEARAAQEVHDGRVGEASRLYEEAQADSMFEAERAGFIRELEQQVYEKQQWDAYLACNPLPDVRDDAQLNAFVSVFREPDTTNAPHLSLQPTLDACAQAEEVVGELLRRAQEAREDKDEILVARALTYKDLLRGLVAQKIDQLTCRFLARTDEYETGTECAFTVAARSVGGGDTTSIHDDGGLADAETPTEKIGFGLWVHSSSRTNRIKRIDFHSSVTALTVEDSASSGSSASSTSPSTAPSKTGPPRDPAAAPTGMGMDVSIELPQSLQKARTCIRLVRTLYDAVSLLPSPSALTANAAATPALARSGSAAVRSGSARPGTRGNHVASGATSGGEGSSVDPLSSSSSSSGAGDESLLDPTSLFDFARRPPMVSSSRTHFVSLGGVLDLSQLLLPPQPKRLRNWTLRDITTLDQHIVNVPYPSEEAIAAARTTANGSGGAGAGAAPAAGGAASSSSTALAPLRVRFTLPPHIYLADDREPLFGYWDRDYPNQGQGGGGGPEGVLGAWRQDGVSILEFDPLSRNVSVSLPTIKPLAVIQPRALDFPYRAWSILPVRDPSANAWQDQPPVPSVEDFSSVAAHTCRLEVSGSRFSLGIEVSGLQCRLVSPPSVVNFLASTRATSRKSSSSSSGSAAAEEYWSSPGSLLAELARAGVNVTPSDEDARYCRKPLKSGVLVQTLHEHLSLLTTVFDVASSTHNVSRPSNVAMVRMRLSRHSKVLAAAAARKAVVDWEAREAHAERTGAPDTSYADFPDALRSHEPMRDENGNEIPPSHDAIAAAAAQRQQQAAIDAEIAALEAEDVAAAEAEAARQALAKSRAAEEDAAAAALSRSASAKANARKPKNTALEDHVPPPKPAELTQQQKYALGFEWVTVLAELIDAPSDPALASSAALAASAASAAVAAASSIRGLSAAEKRARGSAHESLPPGVLLRFTLVRGADAEGVCDLTPLPGCSSHFSLRRCLLDYFADKTPHDLCTAMSMSTPDLGVDAAGNKLSSSSSSSAAAGASGSQLFHFLSFDPIALQTQQTVRRTLNLLRPLIFC